MFKIVQQMYERFVFYNSMYKEDVPFHRSQRISFINKSFHQALPLLVIANSIVYKNMICEIRKVSRLQIFRCWFPFRKLKKNLPYVHEAVRECIYIAKDQIISTNQ